MHDDALGWDDLVRGTTTFAAGSVPDFALTRANGDPLYTLVNPCDDALMKITHVLRGEDLLPSTPRQLALYQSLIRIGVAERIPEFAHLPTVLGEGTKKLSKRDPQSNLFAHRDRGFIPEGLLNYLALLGWAIADDRDLFTLDEMVAAFDVVANELRQKLIEKGIEQVKKFSWKIAAQKVIETYQLVQHGQTSPAWKTVTSGKPAS